MLLGDLRRHSPDIPLIAVIEYAALTIDICKSVFSRPECSIFLFICHTFVSMKINNRKDARLFPKYSWAVITKFAVFFGCSLPDGDFFRECEIIIGKLQYKFAALICFDNVGRPEIHVAMARIERLNNIWYAFKKQRYDFSDLFIHTLLLHLSEITDHPLNSNPGFFEFRVI